MYYDYSDNINPQPSNYETVSGSAYHAGRV